MLFESQLSPAGNDINSLNDSQRDTAQSIIAQAMMHLESLLRLYYLRHGFDAFDALLLVHLVHLSNATLTRLARIKLNPESQYASPNDIQLLRSTLILCLKGLHDQFKNFYMSGVVFCAMRNRLSAEDRDLVGRFVTMKDPDTDQEAILKAQPILSEYVIPMVNLNEDSEAGKVVKMV